MNDPKQINDNVLIEQTEKIVGSIYLLFNQGVSFQALWQLIRGLIEGAEIIYADVKKAGLYKRQLVMSVFRYYDKRFEINSKLVSLLPLPVWLFFVRPFLPRALDLFIEYILIGGIVWAFNSAGLFKS